MEGALLLLYLSAGALARLSAVPDGLLVLSPDGFEPESSIGQGISAAMERGIPLLGVVRERWTPVATPAPDARPLRVSAAPAVRAAPRRRARPVVVAATLAAGAAGGWALFARGAEQRAATRVPPAAQPGPPAAPAHPARPTAVTPAPRRDSLPWTVQLAAYGRLDKALAVGDRLAAGGIPPFVTPVALSGRRGGATVWYRVLGGAYPTRDSALAARARLWKHGLVARGQGDVLRAPYALLLGGAVHRDSLRAKGIPAIAWDSGRLIVGAFESPEQAALTEARLKRAGIPATLVTRMGTTP